MFKQLSKEHVHTSLFSLEPLLEIFVMNVFPVNLLICAVLLNMVLYNSRRKRNLTCVDLWQQF